MEGRCFLLPSLLLPHIKSRIKIPPNWGRYLAPWGHSQAAAWEVSFSDHLSTLDSWPLPCPQPIARLETPPLSPVPFRNVGRSCLCSKHKQLYSPLRHSWDREGFKTHNCPCLFWTPTTPSLLTQAELLPHPSSIWYNCVDTWIGILDYTTCPAMDAKLLSCEFAL